VHHLKAVVFFFVMGCINSAKVRVAAGSQLRRVVVAAGCTVVRCRRGPSGSGRPKLPE